MVYEIPSTSFLAYFADVLVFSDKKTEDQPKTPMAASNVDLIPQETL